MGIDDRDYMRERHQTRWDDRKGRVESKWFDTVNQGHDYQRGRYRPPATGTAVRWLPFALSFLLTAIPAYYGLKRDGWLPDRGADMPFPATGSVTVSPSVDPASATSRLAVVTAGANAVVQLFDPASGRHVISAYVRKHDRATIAVPPGTYRMKIIEGQRWHGRKAFFGSSTTFETVAQLMTFRSSRGNGIDLHRRPNGDLPTRPNWSGPEPL